ncbi:uncharacterized protein GGS25DRAFT_36750 [Hypoxylon fragiforme]|uniref:uncharacterized protein n=1 Tax=Hypoxylon fragiforme TaxID=63214 RepID=UPI0020C6D09E|nr:uncharacterized protein GGS25DRAFT_36750 [Hypoxylon fragiforme]KAI2614157.1 hypothetical protein GGS25DRAFT_36750 [Hypoxylon fragiforme]
MDQARASRMIHSSRPGLTRRPAVALAALAATGIAVAVQYQRTALTRNEQAQKNSPDHPNFYVSVDRSGGGI